MLARSIPVIASSTASPDFISFRPGYGYFTLRASRLLLVYYCPVLPYSSLLRNYDPTPKAFGVVHPATALPS